MTDGSRSQQDVADHPAQAHHARENSGMWNDPPDLPEILDRVSQRDGDAVKMLLETYNGELRCVLLKHKHFIGQRGALCLEDVVSGTWKRMFAGALAKYDRSRSFVAWLVHSLKWERDTHLKRCIQVIPDELPDPAPLPDRVVMARRMLERVLVQLQAELSELEYAAFILRYRDDLGASEIGQILGVDRRRVFTMLEHAERVVTRWRAQNEG